MTASIAIGQPSISVPLGEQLRKEVTPSYSEMAEMEKTPDHIQAIEMVAQFEAGLITATALKHEFLQTYKNWDAMKQRCRKNRITLDPEFEGFSTFLRIAGPRPERSWSIDRINPSGSYSPENCRWASRKIQARNRSNTVTLTYHGETKPLVEWAEIMGLNPELYRARKREGWRDEEVIDGVRMKAAPQSGSRQMAPNIFHLTPWPERYRLEMERAYQRYSHKGEGRLQFMLRFTEMRMGQISEAADFVTWPDDYEPTTEEADRALKLSKELDIMREIHKEAVRKKSNNPRGFLSGGNLPAKVEEQLREFIAENSGRSSAERRLS